MPSIASELTGALRAAFEGMSLPGELGQVIRSDRPDLAPYQCNGCMAAARLAKKAPRAVAEDIVAAIADNPAIAKVEIAGPGFLNLTPAADLVQTRANELAEDERAGAQTARTPDKIVIDFGGPNVAKPMHVGHLRSSVIGDALQRLLRFRGHEVISDIHLGDWGLQMGQLITELQIEQPDLVYFDADGTGPWPQDPPVTIDDLSRMYPAASSACKADETRMQAAREATAELQAGRPGYRELLRQFIAVSRAALEADFARLGVHFDLWKGESDVDPLIPGMIADLKAKGITEESDGALIIRVDHEDDKKEVAPLILLSSAGAALYGTTDLATLLDRKAGIAPDKVLYVVDQRQGAHFEQVFRAADKAGLFAQDQLEHIGFGTVNGTDGKPFKTRAGGVMRLSDLLQMAEEAAAARMEESGIGKEFDAKEQQTVARQVGLAAIKFADLRNQRTTNYIFDLDRFTAFEGKTGPYLLYAAVRIKSILRKAQEQGITPGQVQPETAEEVALVLALDSFDEALRGAAEKRAPHILCEHLFELAQAYSRFYTNNSVLVVEDAAVRASRLSLCKASLLQLETGLGLLGIEAPARM